MTGNEQRSSTQPNKPGGPGNLQLLEIWVVAKPAGRKGLSPNVSALLYPRTSADSGFVQRAVSNILISASILKESMKILYILDTRQARRRFTWTSCISSRQDCTVHDAASHSTMITMITSTNILSTRWFFCHCETSHGHQAFLKRRQ